MPIPKPRPAETQSHFMRRCVPAMLDEGRPEEQAQAICIDAYHEGKQIHCLNISDKGKELLWKTVDRRRQGHLRFASSQIEAALTKQFNQFFDENMTLENAERGLDRITKDPIEEAFVNIYQHVGGDFAAGVWRNFKSVGMDLQTKQEEEDDDLAFLFFNALKDFVSVTLINIVNSMTQTTITDLRTLIKRLQQNPSISRQQFQKILQANYAQVVRARGMLAGRTEVIRASNKGMLLAAASTGLQLKKVWISTRDSRVRRPPESDFNHWTPDGQMQVLSEPFIISGEPLQYPADPRGQPGNTINCRCTLAFQA